MATARDVVEQALKLIGVGAAGETLSAEEQADGLTVLNQMLASWALAGVDTKHSELSATDEITLPDNHLRALRFNLALDLAPEYEKTPSAYVQQEAERGMDRLRAAYLDIDDLELDNGLKRMPSQFWGMGRVR